jgi:environmental stress-induced protein Ves
VEERGGSTREIACWPQGAGMDSFGWRVSVATIAQAGPFSAFPGIDRQIMLLDGDGVRLHSAQAGLEHALTERWQPFAFSGDMALDCDLLGGPSSDFNVMTRRGQWSARLEQLGGQAEAGLSAAGLCMVLQGAGNAPTGGYCKPARACGGAASGPSRWSRRRAGQADPGQPDAHS